MGNRSIPISYESILEWNRDAVDFRDSGRPAEAERCWQQARGAVLNNLGELYLRLGRWQEAETLHREAEALAERIHGRRSPERAAVLNNLASARAARGHLEEAERLLREAVEIHPDAANGWNNLGEVLRARAKGAEAYAAFERALAIADGSDDPSRALALTHLAALHHERGEWKRAESYYRRALDAWEATPGKSGAGRVRERLSGLLNELGRPTEAAQVQSRLR